MKCYITMDTRNGVTYWAVVYNALQICNGKRTKQEALNAAAQVGVVPQAIWDSATGHYFPIDTFN